jgi:hypothetical protein
MGTYAIDLQTLSIGLLLIRVAVGLIMASRSFDFNRVEPSPLLPRSARSLAVFSSLWAFWARLGQRS